MGTDSRAEVERMIKEYGTLKREMAVIGAMIEQFIPVTEMEIIETLSLGKADGARVQNTAISEKTAKVAAIYREVAAKSNDEAIKSLVHEYHHCKSQVDFVDFCLLRLPERLSLVMSDFVQNDLAWTDICEKYHVSNSMVGKYRKSAMAEMTRWHNLRYQTFVIAT